MALFNFPNRNKPTQQEAPASTPPGYIKQVQARKDAAAKAAEKPITPEIKAQVDRVRAVLEKATQHQQSSRPTEGPDGGTNHAHLQKQDHQDKTQAALSPTDGAAGKTAIQATPATAPQPAPSPRPAPAPKGPSPSR